MGLTAILYISLLGFLFGSTLVVSRFSVGQFHPTTYIGLRMVIASLGYMALAGGGPQRFRWPTDRRLWKHAAVLGLFGTAVPMTSIVTSLLYQSSGLTGVLLTSGPAITVLMAHFTLADEPLTWRKSLGVALALGGALLLTLRGETGLPDVTEANPLGYGLVLLAMVCASSMAIYVRKYMGDFDTFQVAGVRMVVAGLVVIPLSLWWVGFDLSRVDGAGYLALLYAAMVGTFGGFLVQFYNIKRFGASIAAMAQYVIPLVAGLGGILFLGETVTLGLLAGAALIVGGIAILNWANAVAI